MNRKSQAASIGHDLFVSDIYHCDAHHGDYDRVIHIWRPSQGPYRCREVKGGKPSGLAIEWTELQSFSKMSVAVVPELEAFVKRPGKILIHCQAGMGRAPCVALLAKIFRGCDPFTALADIQRANWLDRDIPFGLWGEAINEAVEFWTRRYHAATPSAPLQWEQSAAGIAADARRLAEAGTIAPKRRLRVGIVSLCLEHGGAEQWVQSLLRFCDPGRIEWVGVAVPRESDAWGIMHNVVAGMTTVHVGPEAIDALYRACDVALVWGLGADEQRIPPRPRHCKVVLVSHGICDFTARVFARPGEADAAVAVSNGAKAPMGEAWDAAVIPNCYDPDRLQHEPSVRQALREQWGVRPGEHVVGFLGRCSHEKNPEALVRLLAAAPHVRGVHVGIGDTGPLAELATELGVRDRLVLHGPVLVPGGVLAAFDHLLFPSHQDACGITVLEAWAAGLPIIATPMGVCGEHPDLVRTVALNPTGEQLAQALALDLANPEDVTARTSRARIVAAYAYGPARFGKDWTDYLISLAPGDT